MIKHHDFSVGSCQSPVKVLACFAERACNLALVCHFGAYNNFLSTILKNKFSTHLLTSENHKAAVMLWLPEDSLYKVGGMTLFQVYPQAFFCFLWLPFSPIFSIYIFYAVPQLTECLEDYNPFGEAKQQIKSRKNLNILFNVLDRFLIAISTL